MTLPRFVQLLCCINLILYPHVITWLIIVRGSQTISANQSDIEIQKNIFFSVWLVLVSGFGYFNNIAYNYFSFSCWIVFTSRYKYIMPCKALTWSQDIFPSKLWLSLWNRIVPSPACILSFCIFHTVIYKTVLCVRN